MKKKANEFDHLARKLNEQPGLIRLVNSFLEERGIRLLVQGSIMQS